MDRKSQPNEIRIMMLNKGPVDVAENRCEIASNSESRLGRYNLSLFQALMRSKSSMPSRYANAKTWADWPCESA